MAFSVSISQRTKDQGGEVTCPKATSWSRAGIGPEASCCEEQTHTPTAHLQTLVHRARMSEVERVHGSGSTYEQCRG